MPIIYNQQFVFKRLPVPKVTYLVELLCLGKMDLRCSRVLFYCDQIRGYHQIRELHKVISKHIALSRPSATSKYQDILSSSSFLSTIKQQTSATQDKLSNNFVKTEHFIEPQSHKDYFIIHSSLAIKSVKVQVWRKKKKILKRINQFCKFVPSAIQ